MQPHSEVWLLNLGERDDIDDYWEYNNFMQKQDGFGDKTCEL